MTRVALVEGPGMVLGALAALLDSEPDIEVVFQASDPADAIAQLECQPIDVLVTDVEMPGMTGLELCHRVRTKWPRTRVVILTTFARSGYFKRAMESGASAYLLKDAPVESLAEAIRAARQGQRVVDPELAAEAWADPDSLTTREKEVLRLAERGASTQAISAALKLSEGTVRNYLSKAIAKLDADNRAEAAAKARAVGWL